MIQVAASQRRPAKDGARQWRNPSNDEMWREIAQLPPKQVCSMKFVQILLILSICFGSNASCSPSRAPAASGKKFIPLAAVEMKHLDEIEAALKDIGVNVHYMDSGLGMMNLRVDPSQKQAAQQLLISKFSEWVQLET